MHDRGGDSGSPAAPPTCSGPVQVLVRLALRALQPVPAGHEAGGCQAGRHVGQLASCEGHQLALHLAHKGVPEAHAAQPASGQAHRDLLELVASEPCHALPRQRGQLRDQLVVLLPLLLPLLLLLLLGLLLLRAAAGGAGRGTHCLQQRQLVAHHADVDVVELWAVLRQQGLRLLPAGQLRDVIPQALVERCQALLLPLLSQLLW
jgi:hypothetical protein